MAGTWMSIVHGFGGMRIKNGELYLAPFIPECWEEYSFRLVFRGRIIKITVNKKETILLLEKGDPLEILLFTERILLK
jgi:maltose phosphorylase